MRRSPLKAIRVFCVECQGGSFQSVIDCHDMRCPLYEYRHGIALEAGLHRPLRAIKMYCFDHCQAGMCRNVVENCQGNMAFVGPCPLFPFRLGVNPNIGMETREKARLRELKKVADGSNSLLILPNQRPFDAPESTKTRQAIL